MAERWYYRACRKFNQLGKRCVPFYCVVEYYQDYPRYRKIKGKFKKIGSQDLWSDEPEWPFGYTKQDLIECLQQMLKDVQKYPEIRDKKPYREVKNG